MLAAAAAAAAASVAVAIVLFYPVPYADNESQAGQPKEQPHYIQRKKKEKNLHRVYFGGDDMNSFSLHALLHMLSLRIKREKKVKEQNSVHMYRG